MKIFALFAMMVSYAMAASVLVPFTSLLRTPEDDTAIVESSRIKGNFAYSTVEGHAYKAITPVIGHILPAEHPVNFIYVHN